jgi:hypothetical protein
MMRYFEIASGLQLPIHSEEWQLLAHISPQPVSKESLDERQRELARLMVSRGLLDHFRKDEQTYFKVSSITDIWRGRNDD